VNTICQGRKAAVLRFTKMLAKVCLFPFFQLSTEGLCYLPRKSAFILLPKHQRWEDVPLLNLAIPRPLYYVAKHELFLNPLSRWYISSLGGIPLNRVRPLESRQSMRAIVEVLRNDEGLVVFPEGTYYPGAVGPGRSGLIRIIRSRARVPFSPVGIEYSGKRGRTLVKIRLGGPLAADQAVEERDFLAQVMKEIARLSGLS
jgi:1-acyl-sn-glycerol-3-phosphate acyltransferase